LPPRLDGHEARLDDNQECPTVSLSQSSPDRLAQSQLLLFDGLADQVALSEEKRRRMLRLSTQEWSEWSRLKSDGPLPLRPGLSVMLRRLGAASHRLDKMVGNAPLSRPTAAVLLNQSRH
jgi:hypothetical protein